MTHDIRTPLNAIIGLLKINELQMNDYIVKPFKIQQICELIRKYLPTDKIEAQVKAYASYILLMHLQIS